MDKCPKCGAGEDASEGAFACGTRRGANATVKVSNHCLRRQLAAANERAGRLEAQMVELREAFKSCEYVDDTLSMVALEMLESDYDTFTRILGGA